MKFVRVLRSTSLRCRLALSRRVADARLNYAASGIFREMTLEIPGRSMVTP
jgi:hypothetical protein